MTKRLGSEAGLDDRPRRAPGSGVFPSPAEVYGGSNGAVLEAGGIAAPPGQIPQISRKIKACASCRKQKVSIDSFVLDKHKFCA